jgi:hypothetical protein
MHDIRVCRKRRWDSGHVHICDGSEAATPFNRGSMIISRLLEWNPRRSSKTFSRMILAAMPTPRVRQVTMKSTICPPSIGTSYEECLVLRSSIIKPIARNMPSSKALRIQRSKSNFSLTCGATQKKILATTAVGSRSQLLSLFIIAMRKRLIPANPAMPG